ncbi:MAG: HAMP domain-containing sensor histidine kinase [Terricaulis sp.]
MNLNPLNTLTGRMVLVTMAAVALSYAAAFALFANERGEALRRAAETALVERITYTAERLRSAPAARRAELAGAVRDFRVRYDVANLPEVSANAGGGARIAALVREQMEGGEVYVATRQVEGGRFPIREQRRSRRERDDDRVGDLTEELHRERHSGSSNDRHDWRHGRGDIGGLHSTEVRVSLRLAQDSWLNALARLPGERPPPLNVLFGALASVVAVGVGAGLVSRQIGRPLAQLANAARELGAGTASARAPVEGPADLRRAASAFNAMAERLSRQLSRQRQMLWALSHDLRTPITALKLRAELVEDEEARQRLLAPISEIENLTEQALSLARAGASEEARASVDLADIVRTLCGELSDLGLSIKAETNAPVMIECRPTEIARALRNLADNSVRHGGGGTMRVSRNDSNEAVIDVMDQGPGVDKALLSRITAPFFRVDAARTQTDGAGLGLAIAQAVAEAHGGRLELKNLQPRGFCASLMLPG